MEDQPTPAPAADAPTPRTRQFRRPHTLVRPDPDLVARQMEATRAAYRLLGSAEAARAFLNAPDEGLGGRPLDIAGSSAEGLARVIQLAERVDRPSADG